MLTGLPIQKMKVLSSEYFKKENNLKNNNVIQRNLKRTSDHPNYPRDSKKTTVKRFVIIDNGSLRVTHWECFYIKNNKSFCFDSVGGQPKKFFTYPFN